MCFSATFTKFIGNICKIFKFLGPTPHRSESLGKGPRNIDLYPYYQFNKEKYSIQKKTNFETLRKPLLLLHFNRSNKEDSNSAEITQ